MSCMPATFVVGRGRWVRSTVGAGVGEAVGDGVGVGVGDGVSGATVAVGEGLGSATGGCSRDTSAMPAPMTRTKAIAIPPATLVRNCTLIG